MTATEDAMEDDDDLTTFIALFAITKEQLMHIQILHVYTAFSSIQMTDTRMALMVVSLDSISMLTEYSMNHSNLHQKWDQLLCNRQLN